MVLQSQPQYQEFLIPLLGDLTHSHIGAKCIAIYGRHFDVAVEVKRTSPTKRLNTETNELKLEQTDP